MSKTIKVSLNEMLDSVVVRTDCDHLNYGEEIREFEIDSYEGQDTVLVCMDCHEILESLNELRQPKDLSYDDY